MLLAIDIGNTHTVLGRHDGSDWIAVWRLPTRTDSTEDFVAAQYFALCKELNIQPRCKKIICANVVPALAEPLRLFAEKYLNLKILFLTYELIPELIVRYSPPSAVGADRLANAYGAIQKHGAPCIVVDLGTATTLDVVSEDRAYEGGMILPGVELSLAALSSRAAQLPNMKLAPPPAVIGKDTVSSINSGFIHGYAGAIDALVAKTKNELQASPIVVATGGLATMFADYCESIDVVDVNLTLDGLRFIAASHD